MNLYLILGIIFCITLVTGLFIYLFQHKFFFHPEKLPADFKFAYEHLQVEEIMVETEPGAMIDYLHFKTEHPKGLVFYLKGNTKSIKGWGKFAIDFTRLGYEVIMLDYRGFGKSTGRRTSDGLKHDIQFIYNLQKKTWKEDDIIVYGRSLGSGFAAMLAAKNRPRMLILTSPLHSLIRAIQRYLPYMPARPFMRYNLPTYKYLNAVTCPIKIIHGTHDQLVPIKTALELSTVNPQKTRFYAILGAGHINIHQFEEYHHVMEEIFMEKPITLNAENTSLSFNHHK